MPRPTVLDDVRRAEVLVTVLAREKCKLRRISKSVIAPDNHGTHVSESVIR